MAVQMGATIERILVSPYTDEWYLEAVRPVVRLADEKHEDCVA